MTRHKLLETLGTTPDRVESLAHSLSTAQLARRPKEGEWSMAEILNHLLVGEREVISPRLQRMLLETAPKFPAALCGGIGAAVLQFDGELLRLAGHHNASVEGLERLESWRSRPGPGRAGVRSGLWLDLPVCTPELLRC
jgi:hypothetical protein